MSEKNFIRIRTAASKLSTNTASIQIELRQVRIEVGRMFERSSRLSRSFQDMWDRNVELEQTLS